MKRFFLVFLLSAGSLLSLLSLPANAEKSAYIQATITQAYVELHTGPGRGYPIFYIAEKGEIVSLLKQRTDWVKVETIRGKRGWVHVSAISQSLDQNGNPVSVNNPQLNEFAERKWELGFMIGEFSGTDIISAYGGYHFTQNLSLEVEVSENLGNFSSGQAASISLMNEPFSDWRVSPFFTIGGGIRKTNPRATLVQTEDRTDDVLIAGAGVKIYLSNRFMLRLQYKSNTILTSRDDDTQVDEWKIGISAFY